MATPEYETLQPVTNSISVGDFYNGILNPGGGIFGQSNPFLPSGTATGDGSNVSVSGGGNALSNWVGNLLGAFNSVTTPSGQKVQSVSPGTDALNQILGVSPASGDFYKDPTTGATVAPGSTGGVNDAAGGIVAGVEEWFSGVAPRVVIVVLGFVFVGVGLAMFRPQVVQAAKKVAGT